jgi:pimeloyl-ACP methyl ester carboxylesterase
MWRKAAAGVLLAALFGPLSVARSDEQIVIFGQPGIELPIIYEAADTPRASVILFVGGDGDLAHETGSFVLRVRDRFVAAGMSVVIPDTPSDHPGGFGPLFRTWSAHTQDVAAIVAFLKLKAPVPIWALGTSNGTISAASAAANLGPHAIAGVILTSSVWLGGLDLVPVEQIAVPVLVIQDRNDACPASQFALAESSMTRFVAAPTKEFIAVTGGDHGGPRCGAGSPHDLYGIEDQVVPRIIDWIGTHE